MMLFNTSAEKMCLCCFITQGNQCDRDPHHFAYERNNGEKRGQCFPILPLKWIHHGDVVFVPHWLRKEQSTLKRGIRITIYSYAVPVCFWGDIIIITVDKGIHTHTQT